MFYPVSHWLRTFRFMKNVLVGLFLYLVKKVPHVCYKSAHEVPDGKMSPNKFAACHVFKLAACHVFKLAASHVFMLAACHVFMLAACHVFMLAGSHVASRSCGVVFSSTWLTWPLPAKRMDNSTPENRFQPHMQQAAAERCQLIQR